ncbi:MAG: type II secretion system minor pseudopilin GspI [Hyphomonadaceae bacterium]
MSNARTDAGFSLVESLVALGVFAMAGVALVELQTHSLTTFARVETRALADMVAQNELTRLVSANVAPELGESQERVEFARRAWLVRRTVAATGNPAMRRASVIVIEADQAAPVSSATAFVAAPGAAS